MNVVIKKIKEINLKQNFVFHGKYICMEKNILAKGGLKLNL